MPCKIVYPPFDKLKELYWKQKKTSRQIAKMLGVSKSTVSRWLKHYEIPVRKPKKMRRTTFSRQDLVSLYIQKELKQKQIGKRFNVSQSLISHYMRKWNIPTRTHSERFAGENNPFFGKKFNEKAKEKLRNSPYHRNLRGSKNPFYGKHHARVTLAKIIKSRQKKPNKAELSLDILIHKITNDFKYNGDFGLGITIGGKVPDWVNVNGKKQVIELLGHGWHIPNKWFKVPSTKTLKAIVKHYQIYGWDCLAIYDYELKHPNQVIGKLRNFTEVTKNS